jgi:NitT/TauT family transport system permease protein
MAARRLAKHASFYLCLLVIWQTLSSLHIWPPFLFPSPRSVFEALAAGFSDHSFWVAIAVSMKRIAVGYGLSVVLGLALSVLLTHNSYLDETLGGLLVSLQSLPSIGWLPLAILWFGLTEKAILFVVVMGSLVSVTLSMETGRRQIPKIYLMAGRNLGAKGLKLFFLVLLPASLPFVVAGLKQGWAFAWRSLISGEMIFVTLGLGQVLILGRNLNDMSQVIAVMILIVAIGYLVDGLLFRGVERRLQRKWGTAPAA